MIITIAKQDYDELIYEIVADRQARTWEELSVAGELLAKLEAVGFQEPRADQNGDPLPPDPDAPYFMTGDEADVDLTDEELALLRGRIEGELRRHSTKRLSRLLPMLGPVADAGAGAIARRTQALEAARAELGEVRRALATERQALEEIRGTLTRDRAELERVRAEVRGGAR